MFPGFEASFFRCLNYLHETAESIATCIAKVGKNTSSRLNIDAESFFDECRRDGWRHRHTTLSCERFFRHSDGQGVVRHSQDWFDLLGILESRNHS